LATKPVRKKKKNPPDFFFRIQQVMYYKWDHYIQILVLIYMV
jgi:hypothetical protein